MVLKYKAPEKVPNVGGMRTLRCIFPSEYTCRPNVSWGQSWRLLTSRQQIVLYQPVLSTTKQAATARPHAPKPIPLKRLSAWVGVLHRNNRPKHPGLEKDPAAWHD